MSRQQAKWLCPNCGKEHSGLYQNESGALHCGCFFDADPKGKVAHVSGLRGPDGALRFMLPEPFVTMVKELQSTGLFGLTPAHVVERLVADRLLELSKEGWVTLPHLKSDTNKKRKGRR